MPKRDKPYTQAQIVELMSERMEMSKREVKDFFEHLADLAGKELSTKKIAAFTIPEMGVKLVNVRKPARKARKGRNPATGEEITIPAKKAHNVLKARVMKKLKVRVFGV